MDSMASIAMISGVVAGVVHQFVKTKNKAGEGVFPPASRRGIVALVVAAVASGLAVLKGLDPIDAAAYALGAQTVTSILYEGGSAAKAKSGG